jgi:hypothetical protein
MTKSDKWAALRAAPRSREEDREAKREQDRQLIHAGFRALAMRAHPDAVGTPQA